LHGFVAIVVGRVMQRPMPQTGCNQESEVVVRLRGMTIANPEQIQKRQQLGAWDDSAYAT